MNVTRERRDFHERQEKRENREVLDSEGYNNRQDGPEVQVSRDGSGWGGVAAWRCLDLRQPRLTRLGGSIQAIL